MAAKKQTKRTKAKHGKSGPSKRTLGSLRMKLLESAPDHPDSLTAYAGETLRAELLRYAPAMPEED
jgi:hypothetical protein